MINTGFISLTPLWYTPSTQRHFCTNVIVEWVHKAVQIQLHHVSYTWVHIGGDAFRSRFIHVHEIFVCFLARITILTLIVQRLIGLYNHCVLTGYWSGRRSESLHLYCRHLEETKQIEADFKRWKESFHGSESYGGNRCSSWSMKNLNAKYRNPPPHRKEISDL